DVTFAAGAPYQVLLDGRVVKTPGKRPLAAPNAKLASAIADEWSAQVGHIDPASMPLTRYANTAIDAVADHQGAVAVDIAAYAASDLLCYRAEAPMELVVAQAARWDPVVAWAREALDAPFVVASGVMPVEQPPEAIAAIAAALLPHDAMRLTALHILTTLTGSALLAIAHARGRLTADEVWAAAHIDEDYQIALWGQDSEAAQRRKGRRIEFDAASRMLALLQ
ncbi:MAG: ATP12 family chaperone protein, partial [Hyphomicrobium sp.]